MRDLNYINTWIQAYKEDIAEIIREEVKPMEEQLRILEKERNEIILNSQFIWNDKTFKVSDMKWYNNWNYEDCPYTPGFKSYTETLKIFSTNGRVECFSLPDNKEGWYDEDHEKFEEFEDFFIDKFGVSFKVILKKGEVKEY